MKMPASLTYWTADEAAECLDVSDTLSAKLWGFLEDAKNPTPLGGDGTNGTVEYPDARMDEDNDDKAAHWWPKLTEAEQREIARAIEADDEQHRL